MLNPSRIVFARSRRAWTKTRLAKELGVQLRAIHGYESGEYAPEAERLEKMAALLHFPVPFFFGDDMPVIAEHTASFRSMSKMSAALRNKAFGAGEMAFLLNDWIEARFRLPQPDIPDLSDLGPEDAAATLRRMWGLGEAPVDNIIALLESRGVRVYSLAIEAREVDAFSVWYDGKPFVFLNTMKSAEHSRFDAAHELGHLVRDRHSMLHGQEHSPDMEQKANAFASAFLMPRRAVIASKPRVPTLPALIEQKRTWGVSVAALAYRLNSLGALSEWTYRSLCIGIARAGYRTSEPKPMSRESSQILVKVFDSLRDDGFTRADVAKQLSLFQDDIDNLTFGLVISPVPAPVGDGAVIESKGKRPILRIVK